MSVKENLCFVMKQFSSILTEPLHGYSTQSLLDIYQTFYIVNKNIE